MAKLNNKCVRIEITNYNISESIIMHYEVKNIEYDKMLDLIDVNISKDIPKDIRKRFGNISEYKITRHDSTIKYSKGSIDCSKLINIGNNILEMGCEFGKPLRFVNTYREVYMELNDTSIQ